MPNRRVRGRIKVLGNRQISFGLMTNTTTPAPPATVMATANETGDFETDVAQASTYRVTEPSGDSYLIGVPMGASELDIEVLKTNATLPNIMQLVYDHIARVDNPHQVTADQTGGVGSGTLNTALALKVDKANPKTTLNTINQVNASGTTITIGLLNLIQLNASLTELASRNETLRLTVNSLIAERAKDRQILITAGLAQ